MKVFLSEGQACKVKIVVSNPNLALGNEALKRMRCLQKTNL